MQSNDRERPDATGPMDPQDSPEAQRAARIARNREIFNRMVPKWPLWALFQAANLVALITAGAALFVLGLLAGLVVAAVILLTGLNELAVALIGSCDAECFDRAARLWLEARQLEGAAVEQIPIPKE